MPDDLLSKIDGIEASENKTKVLEEKITRLQELVEKQKLIMSEQERLLQEQSGRLSDNPDVPADVIELKEMIGSQRALLNEREIQLDHSKGAEAQALRELELVQRQMEPLQERLNDSYEQIGQLRAELAENKSQVIVREEKNKNLENKIHELETFADSIKDEEVKILEAMEKKHIREKQELKSQISKMDTILLDSKLISTEKASEAKDITSRFEEIRQKQENLINKVGELGDKNREANERIRELEALLKATEPMRQENINLTMKFEETEESLKENVEKVKYLEEKMTDLKKFRDENGDNVHYFEQLRPLMERDVLFKAFLVINDVGGSGIAINDLQKSLGAPAVLVRRHTQSLEKIGLIETNAAGKFVVKKVQFD